jgi:hypothetical protein
MDGASILMSFAHAYQNLRTFYWELRPQLMHLGPRTTLRQAAPCVTAFVIR